MPDDHQREPACASSHLASHDGHDGQDADYGKRNRQDRIGGRRDREGATGTGGDRGYGRPNRFQYARGRNVYEYRRRSCPQGFRPAVVSGYNPCCLSPD